MKKGFTLIEVIMGLFLLGLITVTVLPLVNGIFFNFQKQKDKYNMIYTAEMAIEKIKAYDCDVDLNNIFIYDVDVGQLIQEFKSNDYVEINLDSEDYEYPVKIIKDNKSDSLWIIRVQVYKNGGKLDNVELKAYVPKK